MPQSASDIWREKIDYLESELATTSDADQKFSIKKRIEEAKRKLAELAGQPPVKQSVAAPPVAVVEDDDTVIDVAIVIPLQEEFDELHKEIEDSCQPQPFRTGAYDYQFTHPGATGVYRCVATFVGDMGETQAGIRTDQLQTKWNPKTIVVLGIAAGISGDVMVGDVVVGNLVNSYLQNSKAVDKGRTGYTFKFSNEAYRPSAELVNESRHFRYVHKGKFLAWCSTSQTRLRNDLSESQIKRLISDKFIREQPVVETGHLASGPTVAAASAFLNEVKKTDRKYLGLEMESGGVLEAVYQSGEPSRSLVIRGISDLGDGRKSELDDVGSGALRRYAVQNAIHYLWGLMECDILPKADPVNPT